MAYLDRISAAPVLHEAQELVHDILKKNGLNPQSPTPAGSNAKQILESAREQISSLISANPEEIILVSNGTESVNLGLTGLVKSASRSRHGRTIVVSAIEHVSVMKTARHLEKEGFKTVVIPVGKNGECQSDRFQEALTDDVLLASIQMANPETGTIQDISFLAETARKRNILFHTDAVAAAGWIPIDVSAIPVDALSFSGTQFGGPPGAAALYIRKGISVMPLFYGGLQEKHRRPGMENIPAIAGFGLAAEHARITMDARIESARGFAEKLKDSLLKIDDIYLTGDSVKRIPGHVSVLVRHVEGEALLLMLDMKNIQAASGSSCTAKDLKISPVLTAMGIEHTDAQGSLVFSTCEQTTPEDIDHVIHEVPGIVARLREMSPLWHQQKK